MTPSSQPPPPFARVMPPQQTQGPGNGLGIAGFVISLFGIVACAPVAPLGLGLSLVGLRREPRGLAIAGTVIGAVGTLILLLTVLVFGTLLLACGGAILAGGGFKPVTDWIAVSEAVDRYRRSNNGAQPTSMTQLTGVPGGSVNDPWGTPYSLNMKADGKTLEMRSAGPDKSLNTSDDLTFDLED